MEPGQAVLKKDLVPGMSFKVKQGIPFANVMPGSAAIFIGFDGLQTPTATENIGMQISGFIEGNDLHGALVGSAAREGWYMDITYLNARFDYVGDAPAAKVDFESVILDDQKKGQIIHALKQVDNYKLIFDTWGFGKTFEKGKGISMLFYGPPGTGKTLMAQAIASKLEYSLKIVSNADIQSSSPGEAERNIRKYFKETKGSKSVLLFDECDSLIHSRANVGAIIGSQINELLSQLERFEGVTVFTTNRLGSLDEAVNRRLSIKIEFALPNLEERVRIWQRMFPEEAPLDANINWKKLAKHKIAGGHIKNAVLRAAREAAVQEMDDDKKLIKMEHLEQALKHEVDSTNEFERHKKAWENNSFGWRKPTVDMDSGHSLKVDTKRELKMVRKNIQEMKNG